jgi:multicomponent Na+:H+ antiporter subunit D
MALYGVVYAVLENDARRLLAYHIISQVGYMVCGVGIGTKLALNGATAHAFAHILYKALLFMGTGAVVQMSGRKLLTEMGGLYRTMPKTLGLYMIGACAISAFPLFSGFVSKSMVVSAAGEDHRMAIFLMLTLASAGTFLHTGLKLPWYMFFGKDCGVRPAEPPRNMLAAMGIAAFLCVAIGVLPGVLYARLPFDAPYHPYTLAHVTASAGMLGFTALGFFLLLSHLDPEPKISLDTDWFYRKGTALLMRVVRGPLVWIEGVVGGLYEHLLAKPVLGVAKFMRGLDSGLVDAVMLGIGRTALAIGRGLRTTSSGHSQDQALLMAAGVLVLVFLALGVL